MQRLDDFMARARAVASAIIGAIGPWLAAAWSYVAGAAGRIRRSFVALISSPMAWLAVATVAYGAFAGGYVVGAAGKRALRADLADVRVEASKALQARDVAKAAQAAARVELETADKRIAALEAEVQRLSQRRPVAAATRAPRSSVSPPAATAAPWRPFQN